jgi:hypothetical protein
VLSSLGFQKAATNSYDGARSTYDGHGEFMNASIYDPQVEFLEIGVAVNGVVAWKVYGPDLNGTYGGMQGTGGLEATVLNSGGTATGIINDYFRPSQMGSCLDYWQNYYSNHR